MYELMATLAIPFVRMRNLHPRAPITSFVDDLNVKAKSTDETEAVLLVYKADADLRIQLGDIGLDLDPGKRRVVSKGPWGPF